MEIIINQQVKIVILFILCISLITCLYIKYDKYELFTNENFKDSKTNMKIFTDSEITNLVSKNAINNQISLLDSIFNKYSILDLSITINNNGLPCESWKNYNSDNTQLNNCKIVEGSESNYPQCLVNNILTSCSNFYSDGYINKLLSIDIKTLKNIMRVNIIRNCKLLINDINKNSNDIDVILNLLIDKLNLEKQQLYFINYSKTSIDDKTKLVNKTSTDFEKNENDINVNEINFSHFLKTNNNNDIKIKLYYKIIISFIIIIIIIGIINIILSKF